MSTKIEKIIERNNEIENLLALPEYYTSAEKSAPLLREKAALAPAVEKKKEIDGLNIKLSELRELLSDPDLYALAKEEEKEALERIEKLEKELSDILDPADGEDDKSVIVEIRSGVGGEEAALFAADLLRMYTMYAEKCGLALDVMNINETELSGIKEVTFEVSGKNAFKRFKFESGVHRVQRVPDTESSGRIHTSAVTVAVLPEPTDVEIEINPEDLQIDTYRSGGAGGQHVNKTESAIRITHIPTGTVVECQDERSQYKNKDRAMKILRSRLYERKKEEEENKRADARRSQVGSGDRSQRVRTYNFPQGRVTDHRVGLTLHKLDRVMDGDLLEINEALINGEKNEDFDS
ncbi:MAG: peptide chain release factor 1 [Clostridia bacterium]|nr:peptide chain release factor 1 [Clostridia bacterium]